MFTIDRTKTVRLGEILKRFRNTNNYTFKDVYTQTGIDPATISRLEDGKIFRINPLIITALAKLYNVNPLIFLNIIGYVEDEDILKYYKNIHIENYYYNNFFIEIQDSSSIFLDNNTHLKEFMKLPFLDKYDMAFKKEQFIFIYNNKKEISQEDLGIFSYNNSIIVAFYYSNKDMISLYDYFTKKISIHLKENIVIIGRIVTIIDYSLYNT